MESAAPTAPRNRSGWFCRVGYFGAHRPPEADHASHALQPLTTLFLFFLGELVGATILEQSKGVRFWNIACYSILGLWILISIFTIARWTHEQLTFVVGHVILWLCGVLYVAFVILGFFGMLPGQGLLSLGVSSVTYADDVTAGLPGLKVYAVLNGRQFWWGIPSVTPLYVQIDKDTRNTWRVAKATVDEYMPNGTLMPALAKAPEVINPESGPAEIRVTGLFDGPTYRVTIYLERYGDAFDQDVLKLASQDEDSIRKKYRALTEKDCRQITAHRGVTVSLEKIGK